MKNLLIILIVLVVAQTGFGQELTAQLADKNPLFNSATEENNGAKIKLHFKECGLNLSEDDKNRYIGVSFVIDSTGIPTSPILLFGNDSILFDKVIKCMQSTPRWIPAKKDGLNISCQFNLAFEK